MNLAPVLRRFWPQARSASHAKLPWELVLSRAGPRALVLAYAPVGLCLALFGFLQPAIVGQLVEGAFDTSAAPLAAAKQQLFRVVLLALPVSLLVVVRELRRERQRLPPRSLAWALLPVALSGAPLFSVSMFEYRQPLLTGFLVLALAGGSAAALVRVLPTWRWSERARRRLSWGALAVGYLVFVGWMGFMAHWRFITFHAGAYDTSWETNAVHNIVHSGIPKTSVGAGSYYPGLLLPVNYAALHTPWIYYLYAPFYALVPDARTLIWLQAALMGSGSLGVMLFARRWLRSELLAVVFALAYLLLPHVQLYCMHDIHANYLAIPLCLLALGAMEAHRPRLALLLVLLTCVCREETGVYGIAVGIFWAAARSNPARARYGWAAVLLSLSILLLITRVVMPAAGGVPRYSHFGMFFDDPGIGSLLKSLMLNPWGALLLFVSGPRPEYLWLSLLPLGCLAIFGWRGLVFTLIPVGLLLPSGQDVFFAVGVNYGAPIVVPVVVMSVLGARWILARLGRRALRPERARLAGAVFVFTTALTCSVLYGNIFGKTYKLEFGSLPYRNTNEYDYHGSVALVSRLPPYAERERQLWDVIHHVPLGVPISTSGRINPQLANREVSLLYPEVGQGHPPANQAKYVVLDRLPSLYEAPEAAELTLRKSKQYRVYYENPSGIVFERL